MKGKKYVRKKKLLKSSYRDEQAGNIQGTGRQKKKKKEKQK